MFHIDEKIGGFTLVRRRDVEEISATVYEFEHDGCGTRLVYFDRDDTNKTFAIAFPTPPEDDTGVFHIIEHSVLCGSKKYPLKDPFAELLKGSLNTFLNAMTYEDRTVYPVSSRCEKDFLNLTDVYLDAVFAPQMLENPNIFRQEGRHFEYDEQNGRLTVNGVVYNEMKGAYSSPDEVSAMELSRALYPDTYLSKDSGGDPKAIPDLTYEKFVDTYKKHYHPSLAKIILDGKMDVKRVLSLIDSHLSGFTRGGEYPSFPVSMPHIAPPKRIPFEIPEGEDERGHARFLFGYSLPDYSDKKTYLATTILCDLLAGTNASPLKKALLDKGLAKDAVMYVTKSINSTLILEARDTDEDLFDETERTLREVIRSLADGIDKKRLAAILDNLDFKQREQDFGTLPTGVAYALAAFGYWMYGTAPEEALLTADTLDDLRREMQGDYFENLILSLINDNPHKASVIMIPDKSQAKRNAEKEDERLTAIKEKMSAKELDAIDEEYRSLTAWQQSDDEWARANLPKLELSDITDNSVKTDIDVYDVKGAKILHQRIKTNGIVYISMHFNANDLKNDEVLPLSILSSVLTNLPTGKRDVLELQSDVKSIFGTFFTCGTAIQNGSTASIYLKLFCSALESKKREALDLVEDVMTKTRFVDDTEIKNVILQAKSQLEDAIVSSGESLAISRAESGVSPAASISEYMSGYEAYKMLKDASLDEASMEKLVNKTKALYKRITKRKRLTLSVAGEYDKELFERLIEAFPAEGETPPSVEIGCPADEKEFFVVPSKVAYAALSGKCADSVENLGILRVARSILSYEYLWNTIRVKNGAYGAGFIPRKDGTVTFYSYRDPSPRESLKIFADSAEYLREFAASNADLTKFIIGAIGEYDILLTPKTRAILSTRDYLSSIPSDFEEKVRRKMLNMTHSDLLTCADLIEKTVKNARTVTVGGRESLKGYPQEALTVIEI